MFKYMLDGPTQWPLTMAVVCWRVLTFHLITLSDKYNYKRGSMRAWMRVCMRGAARIKNKPLGKRNNCPVHKMPPWATIYHVCATVQLTQLPPAFINTDIVFNLHWSRFVAQTYQSNWWSRNQKCSLSPQLPLCALTPPTPPPHSFD